MILRAFREAGQALDDGELVCIFPEGQITRTGMTAPFQRGLERIVKGRDVPIIPVHIDRATASIFSPMHASRASRADPAAGDGLVRRAAAARPRRCSRSARRSASSTRRPGRTARSDRRPLHHEFIRQARRAPVPPGHGRPACARGSRCIGALAGAVALARALRPRWDGQANVGILLPTGVAAALVNLAAALVGPGRGQPQLHRGPRRHELGRGAGRAPHRRHQPARSSRRRSSSCPRGSS